MEAIAVGRVRHVGTYNGNPLCIAAARAVLDEICTPEATDRAIDQNTRFVAACEAIVRAYGLPAHVVQCGAKAA